MSHARTISISDYHRRRKRLLIFNQRHQDKAFNFLKLLIFSKKTKSIFVRRDYPARKYFKNNSIKGDFVIFQYRKFEKE